jgi:hypothetical protein
MSARSRERWRRFSILGQLRLAEEVVKNASEMPHFSPALRASLLDLSWEIGYARMLAVKETTEPAELSAKKGS